jgi:hypothetical protein
VVSFLQSDKELNELLNITSVSEATEEELTAVLPGGGSGEGAGDAGAAVHVSLYDCGSPKQVEMVEGRTAHVCMDKMMAEREAGSTWLVGAGATGAGPCNGELIVVASLGGGDGSNASSGLAQAGVESPVDRAETRAGVRSIAVYSDPEQKDCPVSSRPYRSLCVGPVANMVAGPPVSQLRGTTTCIRLVGRGITAANGSTNLISVVNDALRRGFSSHGQLAWGAVTRVTGGAVKAHVMPPFPDYDLSTPELVNKWLQFYEMPAPLTMYTAAISDDRHNDGLRLEHTHFTSQSGAGGHFHYTTTPDSFAYDLVIIMATRLFKEAGAPADH